MSVDLKRPPATAPGGRVADTLQRTIQMAEGPTITFDSTYTSTGAVIVDLFNVLTNMYVVDVVAESSVAWSGTGNVFSVGDSDDTDRFIAASDFVSTDVGSFALSKNKGFKYLDSDPDVIQASVLVSTGTTGGSTAFFLLYAMDVLSS